MHCSCEKCSHTDSVVTGQGATATTLNGSEVADDSTWTREGNSSTLLEWQNKSTMGNILTWYSILY